ncbi:MAG: SH3 domain-containing protein, partial [Thermomicrobium sp.]
MRERTRGISRIALLLTLAILLLPPVRARAEVFLSIGQPARVAGTNGDGLNLRSGPGYTYAVLVVMPEGATVQVLAGPQRDSAGNQWWNVQWGSYTGWALADYLVPASGQAQPGSSLQRKATFRIYAHRLGLVGERTANGHVIQPNDFFVTLPCTCALSSRGGQEFQV